MVKTSTSDQVIEQGNTIVRSEPVPRGKRVQQRTEAIYINRLPAHRVAQRVSNETLISQVVEQICQRPLNSHHRQTVNQGDIFTRKRSPAKADLVTLALKANR